VRLLVIHAHPSPESFNADLHRAVIERLRERNEVEDCNLYAEGFEAILDEAEFRGYEAREIAPALEPHVARLRNAQGLLCMFPTWNYGMPAIVKGYFDRVWKPGVAFELVNGRPRPALTHITHLGVITTYGSPWAYNKLFMFEPNKRVFMRGFARLLAPKLQKLWLAQFSEDKISDEERSEFVRKARAEASEWALQPPL